MYILLLKYCNIRYVFFILCGNKDFYLLFIYLFIYFVSTTLWLYTAEHRRLLFEARASTRSAKSPLIINSSKLRKIAYQNPIRGNLNLPYKPLEPTLSRADLSTEWSAEKASHANIIIYHYYHPPHHHRHDNHHHHPHHCHHQSHQRQQQ